MIHSNIILSTVGENIIGDHKMQNNVWCHTKLKFFSILCLNFCIGFLNRRKASFLYCSPYSYCSSNYHDSNSCLPFSSHNAIAKSDGKLIALTAKKSYNYRYHNIWRCDNYMKGR